MLNRTPVHITLLHGTFAHHAAWAQRESAFAQGLLNALGTDSCELSSHNWSGKNSHQARIESAEELRRKLLFQKQNFPSHKHFVVAHSHGGNVLLYALRSLEDRGILSGIITLGTPFVSARPRNTAATRKLLRWAFPFAAFVCTGLLFLIAGVSTAGLEGAKIVTVYSLSAAVLIWYTLHQFVTKSIPITQRNIDQRFNVQLAVHPPLLCCTAIDDEAAMWLATIRLASNLPATALSLLSVIFPILSFVLLPLALLDVFFDSSRWLRFWGPIGVYGSMTLTASVVIMVLASILIPWLIRAHQFGFGGERISDNLCSDILATSTPVGWLCETLNTSRYQRKVPLKGIHHSSFFVDPKLPEELGTWIRTKANL